MNPTHTVSCRPYLFIILFVAATVWFKTASAQTDDATAQAANDRAVEAVENPASQVPDDLPSDQRSIREGERLFGQYCITCHAVGKQIIGPALASVHNRRPIDWLVRFIRNSQRVIIDEEDEYAQHLFNAYDRQVMPNFEHLSSGEIKSILAYIEVASQTEYGVHTDEAGIDQPLLGDRRYMQPTEGGIIDTNNLTLILMGAVLALILVLLLLSIRGRFKRAH